MKALRIAGALVVMIALLAPALVPPANKSAVEMVASPFAPIAATIGLTMIFVTLPMARRVRFTIRDLLLITIIVALAVGWWLDRSSLVAQRERYGRTTRSFQLELEKYRPRTVEPD